MDTLPPPPSTPEVSPQRSAEILSRIRQEQNLLIGGLAGLGAAIVGGILWAVITVTTEFQIGFMAVGVGYLVGQAVRLGKGIDKVFGIMGAVLALIGCVVGNFFTLIGFVSKQQGMGVFEALSAVDLSKVPDLMVSAASPMDFVFYAIAVYEGYRLSFRKFTEADIRALQQ